MQLLSTVDRVLAAVEELKELRRQLLDVEALRGHVEREIQDRLAIIASAASPQPGLSISAHVFAPTATSKSVSTSERVFGALAAFRGSQFGALDMAKALSITDENEVNAIRTALSRLVKDDRLRRTEYGKYEVVEDVANVG